MDNPAALAGRFVPVLGFLCLAIYFLVKALGQMPRSRRLGNLGLFCGLTALVQPETALGLSPAEHVGLFVSIGVVRLLLGLAGTVLAVAALAMRRDGGVGWGRPLTACGFSLLHVMFGAGWLMFSSLSFSATPWQFQSADGQFRLTLPSKQWQHVKAPDGKRDAFACRRPRMQALVVAVIPGQTEAEFSQAVDASRAGGISQFPLQAANFREGTNDFGNRYAYVTAMDQTPDGKPVFVAHSMTWCPARQLVVEVLFEGLPRMLSEAGKAAEKGAFEKAAHTICLSVE